MKIKFHLFILLFSVSVFAQKQVTTSIDTLKNKIGAQFNLTVSANVDTLSNVVFPRGNTFGRMEVIRNYVVDTIKKDGRYELVKRYGLAQFDSGKYTIPGLKVLINNKVFLTDSLAVEVANVEVDTLRQKMYDIKPIASAQSNNSWVWKLLLILLLLAGIGVLVYWLVKKYQKKKIEAEVYKTPIEKATALLNTLEQKELWQKGEIKNYYSELTDITRNYIEEAIEIPAMESTTFELIEGLKTASQKKKMKLSQETIENLLAVLKRADLVKFAKSRPLDFEITEDRKKIEKAIVKLDEAIPVAVEDEEEDLLNEVQRQKQVQLQLRRKRNKRIILATASVLFLLAATTTYFIVTKGFDYVKDNVIGHPSKELLEGEWVTSEYGNPGILIETPKVLKRMDLTKQFPKEGLALIKEMQSFGYGSLLDNFYVMVSTLKYKQEVQIDLNKGLEGSLKALELQGARNVIVKQERFDTKEGITGVKGYGTFTLINELTRSSTKLYYEILLFGQDNGLQQIIIVHEEGDPYAKQISDRMLQSVALKKANGNE
ncbi:MAG TPA: hypothetical protein VF677_15495 [Flavobacterium sp.]|jgi:hypothetical protein